MVVNRARTHPDIAERVSCMRYLLLLSPLLLLLACAVNTDTNKDTALHSNPTATPKASNADLAVGQLCFPMVTGLGVVEEGAVRTVYLSDPDTLTRHQKISEDVINLVQRIVDEGEPISKTSTDELYDICKRWHDADFDAAFKKQE